MSGPLPRSQVDPFAAGTLADPYGYYAEFRAAGPVVHVEKYDLYAVSRFADVQRVLADWQTFSSARGMAINEIMNDALAGTVVGTDPPDHARLRSVLERPIAPKAVGALRPRMEELSEGLVERLVALGSFDAVSALARFLPLTVVSELVGLPEEGRQRMLAWAAASFDGMAPLGTDRTEGALATMGEMMDFVLDPDLPARLRPDGWAARLHAAAASGEITPEQFPIMMQGYLSPSLDTTINASANLVWLLGRNPDQWQQLRERPALIPRAINEAIRLESPIQFFTRLTTREVEVDGATIPAGKRVLVMYAAANRDERHYHDANRFLIDRNNADQLGFGHANHRCVGMNLAKLEITSLLQALVRRVERFEILTERRVVNNMLRGFEALEVSVTAAASAPLRGAVRTHMVAEPHQ